jgi:hypothetical protein
MHGAKDSSLLLNQCPRNSISGCGVDYRDYVHILKKGSGGSADSKVILGREGRRMLKRKGVIQHIYPETKKSHFLPTILFHLMLAIQLIHRVSQVGALSFSVINPLIQRVPKVWALSLIAFHPLIHRVP